MTKTTRKIFNWETFLIAGCASLVLLVPEVAEAQLLNRGGGLESKLGNLRDALTGVVLPLISTIGLLYAVILSIVGSGEGRGKVIGVVVLSMVGFMARYIIEFFQGITG